MEKVRWGILGIGGIASRRTAPEIVQACRYAELAAVMDLDAQNTQALAERFGVSGAYTRVEDLLADPRVEAVYIATPPYLHLAQVQQAAQAGKHILCEKPLGLNVPETEQMLQRCRAHGVKLGVAFMMRFHTLHRKAQQMIAAGDLGRPVFARAQLSCWYPPIEGAWRQIPELGGGGSLMDMGSHCIDLLEVLLGSRVREVSAFQGSLAQGYPVEDTSVALVRFENGAVAAIDNLFNVPDAASHNRLEVYGTGGSLLAEGTIGQEPTGKMMACLSAQGGYEAQQVRSDQPGAQTFEVQGNPTPLYATEVDHISECIRKNTEPDINGEVGLWSAKVLAACYESARSKQAVTVA